jgi:hypothetical protein
MPSLVSGMAIGASMTAVTAHCDEKSRSVIGNSPSAVGEPWPAQAKLGRGTLWVLKTTNARWVADPDQIYTAMTRGPLAGLYIDIISTSQKELDVATSSIRNDPPNPRDKDLRETDLHEHDPHDKLAARIAIVEEHVRLENEHDLEGDAANPRFTGLRCMYRSFSMRFGSIHPLKS